MICNYCRAEIPDESTFCPICGQAQAAAAAPEPASDPVPETCVPVKTQKKNRKLGLLLGGIGLLLVVAVVLVFLCIYLRYSGPVTDIVGGFSDLEGNFTAKITITPAKGKASELELLWDSDLENEKLNLYLTGEVDGEYGEMALYEGEFVSGSGSRFASYDISEEMDIFYELYNDADWDDLDWETILNTIEDDLYDEALEYVDFEALNECLVDYYESLNDEEWLVENAGFSEEKEDGVTYYTFDLDLYDFADASLEQFEPVFREEEDFEDLCAGLEEMPNYLNKMDLELIFALDGGDLQSVEIKVAAQGESGSILVEFSDVGSTEIDVDRIEYMLDQASKR